MLAHPLRALLVFEHGFIQIRFGIFDFFCFYFMSNKLFFNTTKFYTIYAMNVQKQPPEVFCRKMCSWKFHKIHRKTPVPEAFFNKVAGLRPGTLLKKRLCLRTLNFVKFLRASFHKEHLLWLLLE